MTFDNGGVIDFMLLFFWVSLFISIIKYYRYPFLAYPTQSVIIRKNIRWKVGGGVTYHLNPHISGSFTGYDNRGTYFNDSVNDRYEDALGGVAQIDYIATDNFAIGIRGTYIEYKLKNDPSITANGNSIGFNLSYAFGERSEFR